MQLNCPSTLSMAYIQLEMETPLTFTQESVAELINDSLIAHNNQSAIVDTRSGQRWSSREVLKIGKTFASFLSSLVSEDEIVLIVGENSGLHALCLLGILFAGAVYCSVPIHSSEREIREFVRTIDPKVIISERDLEISSIKTISMKTIEKLLSRDNEREDFQRFPLKRSLDSIATLVLSSGSEGKPKPIVRTQRNHLAVLATFQHQNIQPLSPRDVLLSSGFQHICGQRAIFASLFSGSSLALVPNDENHETVFRAIEEFSISSAVLIGTQLNWLVKNRFPRDKLKSVRDVVTGATHVSHELFEQIQNTYGFSRFRNSYGQSESGFSLFVRLNDENAPKGTVGRPAPGVEVEIRDTSGQVLGPNSSGQLFLKSQQISGALLTGEALSRDKGFFASGDFGYYDSRGYFFIEGRLKEVMKVDGIVVSPAELETLLLEHEDVTNAAIVALNDEMRGQIPKAFVTLRENSRLSAEEVRDWHDLRVNDHKKLRGGVQVVSAWPRTHSGKTCKSLLK